MEVIASFEPGFDLRSLLQTATHLQDQNEIDPALFSLSPLSSVGEEDDDIEEFSLPSCLVNSSTSLNDDKPEYDIFGSSPLSSIGESLFDDIEDLNLPPLISSTTPLAAVAADAGSGGGRDCVGKADNENADELTSKMRRKRKNKERSRAARKKKKQAKKAELKMGEYEVRDSLRKQFVNNAVPILCPLDFSVSEVTNAAFIGKDDAKRTKKTYTLGEIREKLGFKIQEWDGRTAMPIIDKRRQFIGLLAGSPNAANWSDLHDEAVAAMESRRSRCVIPKPRGNKPPNRRGKFVALSCGVSHGGGQEKPGNLCPDGSKKDGPNAQVLRELRDVPIFKRLAGFVSAAIATWAPDLHSHYVRALHELHEANPELERTFDNSIFSAFTYNFGPRTVCFKHKDFGNLPYGLCAITSFGNYDYKQGGHLVLWECRLAIEFPPGSTILITSAVITHSNTSISPNESRYSFAQYTAGGLFRWTEHGCRSSYDYYDQFSTDELEAVLLRESQRWVRGLSLLPIIPEKRQTCSTSKCTPVG